MTASQNKLLAGICSFFIPGLGQWLIQSRMKEGIIFFLVWFFCAITCVGLPVSLIAWIWAVVDAVTYEKL